MASATGTPSKALARAEVYFGGAGEPRYRNVIRFAEARRPVVEAAGGRVLLLHHDQGRAAAGTCRALQAEGFRLCLVGHSWGADAMLHAARRLTLASHDLLIGADPVAKPGSNLTGLAQRPEGATLIHIDARPPALNRSDLVKAAGCLIGGIPAAFRTADVTIISPCNHWNFAAMMHAQGPDGRSALDWMGAPCKPGRL